MELGLLLAWIFSPLGLIPAVVILAAKNSSLKKQIAELQARLRWQPPPEDAPGAPGADVPPVNTGRYAPPAVHPKGKAIRHNTFSMPVPPPVPGAVRFAAPAGAAGPTPKREYGPKPAVSPVNIVLAIGAGFILLAGLIFATTTWKYLSGPARVLIIGVVTAAFFAASWFTEKRLGIKQTGRAFFALGCLFIPVTMLAVGYFELLGSWFSLAGEGKYLLGLAAALAAGAAFAFGAKRYALALFAWPALLCSSLSVYFFFRCFYPPPGLLSLLLSLYCAALVLAAERAAFPPNPFSILTDRLRAYALCNLLVFGGWLLLPLRGGWLSAVSTLLLALLFLSRLFDSEQKVGQAPGAALFTLFWLAGTLRLGRPYGFDRMPLFLAVAAAVVLLLASLEFFGGEMRRYLRLSFGVCTGAAMLANLPAYWENGAWTVEMLCSCAILTTLVTWLALRRGEKPLLMLQPVFLLVLINALSEFLFPLSIFGPFLSALLSAAAFWLARLAVNRKNGACLRSGLSDILYLCCCLFRGIALYWLALSAEEALLSIAALLLFCSLLGAVALEPREWPGRRAAVWLLPHAFLVLLPPVGMLAASASDYDLFRCYLLALGCAAIGLLWVFRPLARRFDGSLGLALSAYGLLFPLVPNDGSASTASLGIWLVTIYWGVRLFLLLTNRLPGEQKRFGPAFCALACGCGSLLAAWMTALDLFWPGLSAAHLLCAPALLASAYYLCWLWLSYRKPESRLAKPLLRFVVPALTLLAAAVSLANQYDPSLPLAVPVLEWLVFQGLAYDCLSRSPRTRALQVLPLLWVYPLLLGSLARLGYTWLDPLVPLSVILLFFVMAAVGRFSSQGFRRAPEGTSFDWFAVVDLAAPAYLLSHNSAYWRFGGWLLLGLWAMLFYRRFYGNSDRLVLTVALAALCAAFWAQPFLKIPGILSTEWMLLAPALFVVILRHWIWTDQRRITGMVQFGFAVAAHLLLGFEAVLLERPADALILGVLALAMLIGSFAMHLRRWFALSASTLLALALYMTRGFWLSLAWWVYLLAVGLLLIGAASLNEFCRQRGVNLWERVTAGVAKRWER